MYRQGQLSSGTCILGKFADFMQPLVLSVSICLPIAGMHVQDVDFFQQQIDLIGCGQVAPAHCSSCSRLSSRPSIPMEAAHGVFYSAMHQQVYSPHTCNASPNGNRSALDIYYE